MNLFPAIDLYEGKAVRLVKGDYAQMTVYSENPEELGVAFRCAGAQYLHTVDLEGAKDGTTPNLDIVQKLVKTSGLKVQVGGGIRSPEIVRRYLDAGVHRVIIGTGYGENVWETDCRGRGCAQRYGGDPRLAGTKRTHL